MKEYQDNKIRKKNKAFFYINFFPVPNFSDTGSDTTKKNEKFPVPGIPGTGTSHSEPHRTIINTF